jgi:hypothetical protein
MSFIEDRGSSVVRSVWKHNPTITSQPWWFESSVKKILSQGDNCGKYDCGIDMIRYDMIYLLTAIGLPPDGSSTVHIYTRTLHRTSCFDYPREILKKIILRIEVDLNGKCNMAE